MKLLKFLVFLPMVALAQTPLVGNPGEMNSDVLRHEGQLVSVQLVIGEPIRIFVVGREEAKLNLSELGLTVRRLKPYPGKVLKTSFDGNNFVISETPDLKDTTDLEVTTVIKNKKEIHQFKIKTRAP